MAKWRRKKEEVGVGRGISVWKLEPGRGRCRLGGLVNQMLVSWERNGDQDAAEVLTPLPLQGSCTSVV